jgi:hypothetical protein
MKRLAIGAVPVIVIAAALFQGAAGTTAVGHPRSPAIQSIVDAQRGIAPPRLPNGLFVPALSGGFTQAAMEAIGRTGHERGRHEKQPQLSVFGCPNVFKKDGRPNNVRANIDCGFRFQSEEWVSVNPTDPNNVIVSQNDSKLSGNRTGVDFSLDGGKHFGDSVLPSGRVNISTVPGGQWSFDAYSDPGTAFDSQGNLYYSAIGFDAFQDAFAGEFVWSQIHA